MSYIKAGTLSHSIELAKCVKLYAGLDGVFLFPYRGKLSGSKIARMAVDLMEFYPNESLHVCIHAVTNLAERCSWTHIGRPVTFSHPSLGQDMTTVTLRGDGWMNMREPSAVIIFNTYTDIDDGDDDV